MLSGVEQVAVFCADGIGDALIFHTLAYNLKRNGYRVTLLSPVAEGLQAWFPHVPVKAPPPPSELPKALGQYDFVFAEAHSLADRRRDQVPVPLHVFEKRTLDRRTSMVENLAAFCRETLGLSHVSRENGISPPQGLIPRKHRQRVIIHPESKDEAKNWPPRKFIGLALRLEARGYGVSFILGPGEQSRWRPILDGRFEMPRLSSLDALARYTCESGWMIGTDSGVGHLANNLGVPTLSVFSRRGTARYWRPGWGPGAVIYPPVNVPGPWGRRHWARFLPVRSVMRAFQSLTSQES